MEATCSLLGQIMAGFATDIQHTGAPVGIVNSDQTFMRGPINFGYKNFGEIEFMVQIFQQSTRN